MEALFEKVGAMITYIHMPVFEDSKRSRGFASVTFTKREYVKLAVELDGSKLPGGRWLKVEPLDKARVNKKKQGKKDAKASKNKAAEAAGVCVLVKILEWFDCHCVARMVGRRLAMRYHQAIG